jgi:hypothetical protein
MTNVAKVWNGSAWVELRDAYVFNGSVWTRISAIDKNNPPWEEGSLTGPFTPLSLSGLYQWFDAQDISTVTKDGSDYVTQWNDKSGNARHLTQTGTNGPTYTANAINGGSAMVFSATKYLNNSTAGGLDFLRAQSNITIMMVLTVNTRSNSSGFYYYSNGVSADYSRLELTQGSSTGNLGLYLRQLDGDARYVDITSSSYLIPLSTPLIHRLTIDYASRYPKQYTSTWGDTLDIENAPALSTGNSVSDTRSIIAGIGDTAATSPYTLGEIIMVRGALSQYDIVNINAYFRTKWGIS